MENLFSNTELTPTPPIDYTEALISINSALEECSLKLDRLSSVSVLLFVVLGVTFFVRCMLSILK